VLEAIFKAYRVARGMENGEPLQVLQQQLALHAPDLIQHNFMDLKTVIATMQSLEGTRPAGGDTGKNAEQTLQEFLRGPVPETEAEGMVQ
jgi:hypothetical protein